MTSKNPVETDEHFKFWLHIKNGGSILRLDRLNQETEILDLNSLNGNANKIYSYGYKDLFLLKTDKAVKNPYFSPSMQFAIPPNSEVLNIVEDDWEIEGENCQSLYEKLESSFLEGKAIELYICGTKILFKVVRKDCYFDRYEFALSSIGINLTLSFKGDKLMHLTQAVENARKISKTLKFWEEITFEIVDAAERKLQCTWVDPEKGTFQIKGVNGVLEVDDYRMRNPFVMNQKVVASSKK